jgi:MFS family permease
VTAVRAQRRRALVILAALGIGYIASQFYRSFMAVIAPELMRELQLSAEITGALSGTFFLVFAFAQVPVGMLLDRFGGRLVNASLLTVAVAGALAFAAADGPFGLMAARALMGFGVAGSLIGAYVVLGRWFPPDRFATVGSVLVALGMIGTLVATSPLAWLAGAIGWRGAFAIAAAVTAALALLVLLVVRDAPPGHGFHARRRESLAEALAGLGEVIRNPRLPYFFVIQLFVYSSMMTVMGLWGGPYLNDVHHLAPGPRGLVLLAMGGGVLIGNLCYGPADRFFDTRQRIVQVGGWTTAALFAVLALVPRLALWQATTLLTLIGACSAFMSTLHAHGRAMFPDRLVGRGMTILNMAVVLGTAIAQTVSGWIVGAFVDGTGAAPEHAYRLMFGYLAAALALALMVYAKAPDVRPSEDQAGRRG